MNNSKPFIVRYVLLLSVLLVSPLHAGLTDEGFTLYDRNNFTIGVGLGLVEYNTQVKITDTETDRTVFIDLENTLGLPSDDQVRTIYGGFRFTDKHHLLFGYFDVGRDSTLLEVNENFNDIIVLDAEVTVEDNSRFYYLGYGYSMFQDERSSVQFVAGLQVIDMQLQAEARGSITIGDDAFTRAEVFKGDLVAPHPLFGVNIDFAFTPKWSVSTKFSLVHGTYDGDTASVIQTNIISNYRVNQHVGVLLGWTYFHADLDIDDDTELGEIDYGYNGAFLGLHTGF